MSWTNLHSDVGFECNSKCSGTASMVTIPSDNFHHTLSRGGSRGVRRVLEHPSNIHTFTAKNDNCSEAVLKIIKLLLLIMTTALKLC